MARQWFVSGIQVYEDGELDLFFSGIQVSQNQADAGVPQEDFLIFDCNDEPTLSLQLRDEPTLSADVFDHPSLEMTIMADGDIHVGEAHSVSVDDIRTFLDATALEDFVGTAQLKDAALDDVGAAVDFAYIGGGRHRNYATFPGATTALLTAGETCYIVVTGTAGGLPVNRRLTRRAVLAGD